MQIQESRIQQGTIEEFAEYYGLVMEVRERRLPVGDPNRFYAHFRHCEVKERSMLRSESGNGSTKEQAIADYAGRISMTRLVFDAYGKERREIDAWRFVVAPSDRTQAECERSGRIVNGGDDDGSR